MTIRRQYSLPNCTLVLDGLSDGSPNIGLSDPRPVMSSLFNAECHFVGRQSPLFGGRDFLTSLVATVSNYAQEFLSGIPHPSPIHIENSLVSLTKGNRDHVHHLHATPDPNAEESGMTGLLTDGKPTEIQLSTVQLFDLLEAIDQFLADRRTLPDIMEPLRPVTKALAQPISQEATPIGLGLTTLFVTSLISIALPFSKIEPPKFVNPSAPKQAATPVKSESKSSATTDKITESTQLGFLNRKLRQDLNQNWQQRSQIKQEATFRVSMNQQGEIVKYQADGEKTDLDLAALTPLPKLSLKKADSNQSVGDFKVVFKPSGALQISPWDGFGKATLGQQIEEPKLKITLAAQLKKKLESAPINVKSNHKESLNYRVAVTKNGDIVDYDPEGQSAYDYENQTSLPELAKYNPQVANSEEPIANYYVVFKPDGKVEVTSK